MLLGRFLLAVGLVAFVTPAFTDTLLVPEDYDTIQEAIDEAEDGDDVVVAAGVYEENIDFDGKSIILISEDGAEDTVIDGGGVDTVVKFENDEDEDAVLDGFTIRNGGDVFYGAGILIDESSPTIQNNIIEDNNAGISSIGAGGGIYISLSDSLILNNTIRNNKAISTAEPPISVGIGGGIYVESAVCASDCSNSPTIEGNVIVGNEATDSGGGIYVWMEASPLILGNIIANNESGRLGGGASVVRTEDAVFDRNTIYGNSAENGGGLWGEDRSDDCDIFGCGVGPSTVRNCILWGNEADESAQLTDGEFTLEYSIVEDGAEGDTNLDEDPLLAAPGAGDFTVDEDSPAVDAGDPDSDDDPDGSRADIGAHPFVDTAVLGVVFRRGDIDGSGTVSSITDALTLLLWAFGEGEEPPCLAAADCDGNGSVSGLSDALYLLDWTFSDGAAPPAPGPDECGMDPNELDCNDPPSC